VFWSQFFFPEASRAATLQVAWCSMRPRGYIGAPVRGEPSLLDDLCSEQGRWYATDRLVYGNWDIPAWGAEDLRRELKAAGFVEGRLVTTPISRTLIARRPEQWIVDAWEGGRPMADSSTPARIVERSDVYAPQIGVWAWALEDTRRRTMKILDGLTQAALDWVPPEGGNSIGVILYHLVAIELSYLYEDILERGWAPELAPLLPYDVRDEEGQLTAVCGENLQTHLHRLEQSRALLLSALQGMTAAEWQRPREIEGSPITPEWALHHLIQHEAEHRGQIGELRRRAQLAHKR
jgi:uncharacterized damage-inducible protein DinB